MTDQRIALDFDSVLAATANTAFDLMFGPDHGWTYSDIDSWGWGLEKWGTERYLSAMWHSWTLRPLEVPTMEPCLQGTTKILNDTYETVDVVTAHPDHMGITEGKKEWLDDKGIHFDNFVVADPDSTKATMDYDVFIDDKPALVGEASDDQRVLLRDHRYNRDELLPDGEYTRVRNVFEAFVVLT